jgi:hypothetical protein
MFVKNQLAPRFIGENPKFVAAARNAALGRARCSEGITGLRMPLSVPGSWWDEVIVQVN